MHRDHKQMKIYINTNCYELIAADIKKFTLHNRPSLLLFLNYSLVRVYYWIRFIKTKSLLGNTKNTGVESEEVRVAQWGSMSTQNLTISDSNPTDKLGWALGPNFIGRLKRSMVNIV